jgi:hypothetical protein
MVYITFSFATFRFECQSKYSKDLSNQASYSPLLSFGFQTKSLVGHGMGMPVYRPFDVPIFEWEHLPELQGLEWWVCLVIAGKAT